MQTCPNKKEWDHNQQDTANLNSKEFRDSLLEYNIHDCKILYDIIIKFYNEIKELFNVNILRVSTLPSLAFKIFRTHFNNFSIPITFMEEYNDFKKAYFGGHVDVYRPYGKNLFYYDINSLYPSVMKDYKYPTDIIGKFIGDIRLVSAYEHYFNNNLGIYKVKVKAPNIKNPILPVKSKGQLLYPYGNWTAWYFSEEIKNAEKYGYEFEILGGYIFDSADLFSSYIADLYKIKETSHKNSAMYLISKLLLNSLYGKMAINPNLNDYQFWTHCILGL